MDCSDRILIEDLVTAAVIGTRPEERAMPQKLVITAEIGTDFSAASRSDDLRDAVDYSALETLMDQEARASSFALLESLAGRLCDRLLAVPGVGSVRLRIEKPGAARLARTIALEMTRERKKN